MATAPQFQEIKGRSLWQDARRRLFANKAAVASMVVLAAIAFYTLSLQTLFRL